MLIKNIIGFKTNDLKHESLEWYEETVSNLYHSYGSFLLRTFCSGTVNS